MTNEDLDKLLEAVKSIENAKIVAKDAARRCTDENAKHGMEMFREGLQFASRQIVEQFRKELANRPIK